MYYCQACKSKFERPNKIYETHGLSTPPFEVFYICPFCGSENFQEIQIKYCHCCGARLKPNQDDFCSENCRITAEKLRLAEYKRTKFEAESPLHILIKELTEYNLKNNTDYSYGQYVTLIKPKLGRKKK